MNIFVIVVTYKGQQWYDRCFESLRQSSLPVTTIVVDNASNDGSADYIRERFPEIVLIESKENLGFGKANNLAMRYALDHGCDFVFLLNQDTWMIDNDLLRKLTDVSSQHPEFGILSPMHVQADGQTLGMMWENGNNLCSIDMLTDMYKGKVSDVYETNYVNAAAWLLPKRTLLSVGGFDPIYTHYEEDDDYLNRACYHGLKIGICPSTKLVHDHKKRENPFTSDEKAYHHEQELIVKLTNINQSNTISKYYRYCVRKLILNLLTFNWKSMKPYVKDLRFVRTHSKRIAQSRKMNMQIGATWI